MTHSCHRSAGECEVATHAACRMPRGPPPEGKQLLGCGGLTLSEQQGRLPAASPLVAHTWRSLRFLCRFWHFTASASLPALCSASCFPAKCRGHLQACHHQGRCAAPPQRMTLRPPLQQNNGPDGAAMGLVDQAALPATTDEQPVGTAVLFAGMGRQQFSAQAAQCSRLPAEPCSALPEACPDVEGLASGWCRLLGLRTSTVALPSLDPSPAPVPAAGSKLGTPSCSTITAWFSIVTEEGGTLATIHVLTW